MPLTLEAGAVLGERYRLERVLGEGGMGIVWGAVDLRTNDRVALRVLAPRLASEASDVGRFLREAKVAGAIAHPSVVPVRDVFTADGSPVLVMEWLDGESLRDRLKRDGALSVGASCTILAQVVSAVGAAHERGIVHRDLKPENIFLVGSPESPSVRVLDFGIAKLLGREGELHTTAQTTTGAVLGTPHYMSPEQATAESDLDARSDVWSLGVILYECLSGHRPAEGRSFAHVLRLVAMGETTPLAVHAPDLPVPLLDLVNRMLSLSRADRPSDLREVLATLREHTSIEVKGFGDAKRARRARRAAIAAVAAVACVAVAALAMRGKMHAREATSAARATRVAPCTSNRDCRADPAEPMRCRSDGACVALASQDCEVHASPLAIDADDTVWFGTLFPAAWKQEARGVDLARQDFDQMMSGFANDGGTRVHPFGVVACDDHADAMRAAKHLVEDVQVTAIIGFHSAAELIDLGSAELLPHGVVAVASLTTSPLVTAMPSPAGSPRLVWRTTYSSAESVAALAHVVPELHERQLRATAGILGASAPMRVALLRGKTRGGATFSELLFKQIRFNGRSALENGDNYREFVVDDASPSEGDDVRALADEIARFAPHVAIVIDDDPMGAFVEPLERAWSRAGPRPRYQLMTPIDPPSLAWVGRTPGARGRFFGLEPVVTRSPNAQLVMHFNETASEKVTLASSPCTSYDAFYLLAYATYALGEREVKGASLASAIARLVPPGVPVDVGPTGIYTAYGALRRGESIDLNGASGSLDFDLQTGEPPIDQCVLVPAPGEHPDNVESGIVYREKAERLEGEPRY